MAPSRPFIIVDASLLSNPKLRRAGRDATLFYVAALGWAKRNWTDGFIPDEAIAVIAAEAWVKRPARILAALTATSSEDEEPPFGRVDGGWLIHDYLEWQTSRAEAEARSALASQAASARWRLPSSTARRTARRNANGTAERNAESLGATRVAERGESISHELDSPRAAPARAREDTGSLADFGDLYVDAYQHSHGGAMPPADPTDVMSPYQMQRRAMFLVQQTPIDDVRAGIRWAAEHGLGAPLLTSAIARATSTAAHVGQQRPDAAVQPKPEWLTEREQPT